MRKKRMSNETGAKSLQDLINGKEFRIPMYQRNYKWNAEAAENLVTGIVDAYENEIKKSIGLITLYKKEDVLNTYDVIDGQQRFTTLAILLSILDSSTNIVLSFERDEKENNKRLEAIKSDENCKDCTDVNRIKRNRKAMNDVLKKRVSKEKWEKLADYILNKVIMLCSIVNSLPVEEFMNLNAYKTAFSISDHIRANLIALNSFHKDELEEKDNTCILARCLSKYSYKTAVSILYNNIQEKLYEIEKKDGKYRSIYALLKEPEIIIEPKYESRINIVFGGMLKEDSKSYESGEITENLDYWIKMLQKLAFINRLLDELKNEFEQGEYHSFKQIDDYQKMTKKSFIREVFDGIDNEWDSQTLAKEIQKYSSVDSVLIKCLNQDSKKLANRYLEAFVHSEVNSETYKQADNEVSKKVKLPQMAMDEVVEEISGCGRYVIERYEIEHREDLNIRIDIPPVLDLEDRENINFGGSLGDLNDSDEINVGTLFNYKIKIPVIQRDYCMGARITGENDFLSFLLDGYEKYKNNKDVRLSASTVVIAVSNGKNIIYIFDGQQRTFTLYNILKYCNCNDLKEYFFVGRDGNLYGSTYSKEAVENLKSILQEKINVVEINDFAKYIKEKVFLKVKTVDNVSGAEQFFMDINGGVALKKYEIYKAMLCNQLLKLEREDVVKKLENEWLDFFYKYRKEYLEVDDIEFNESDEEEALEIRFIEYVIRFVYRMKHFGLQYTDIWMQGADSGKYSQKDDKHYKPTENFVVNSNNENKELLSFDEIESKGEMVGKLGYINNLSNNDVEIVVNIMESITSTKISCEDNVPKSIEILTKEMKTNSTGGNVKFCRLKCQGTKQDVLETKEYYVKKFIWSLSDDNREKLKKYYRYKNVEGLRKIYDDDQIMRDILLKIIDESKVLGDSYPYQLFYDNKTLKIYGGYNNTEVDVEGINVKEIPAYYAKGEIPRGNILRLQYLYEKSEIDNNELYFALVKKDMEMKYEDGSGSNVCQLKEKIPVTYEPMNRTEAYCLRYIEKYIV